MHESIQKWLTEKMKLPGILACGVRCPDRKTFTRSQSPQFSAAALENACRCLADAFQVLSSNRFPGQCVRWVFENYYMHGSIRSDGVCVGILTRRGQSSLKTADLEQLMAEFQTLET